MTSDHWFDGVHEVVADDLRFKARLGIGEDAYASVRFKKAIFEAWDVAGVAATGAQVAQSAFIAQKFFAAQGLLSVVGIGAAATPIGWVVAASVVTGGAWFGITRYLKSDNGRTTVIPEFINTPLDMLGLGLFDLMAPLAIRVAAIDGRIDEAEISAMRNYFVTQWGYSTNFVEQGLGYLSEDLSKHTVRDAARTLAVFARENPDCKADTMLRDIVAFLVDVMSADGVVDEREELAIEKIRVIFAEELKFSATRALSPISKLTSRIAGSAGSAFRYIREKRGP